VLVSPILVPTIQELRTTSYMVPAPAEALSHSADLVTFFEPMRGQQLWGRFFLDRETGLSARNATRSISPTQPSCSPPFALFGQRLLRPRIDDRRRTTDDGREFANRSSTDDHHSNLESAIRNPQSAIRNELPGSGSGQGGAVVFPARLGPVLQINGNQIRWIFSPDIPLLMPYRLIENLPIIT